MPLTPNVSAIQTFCGLCGEITLLNLKWLYAPLDLTRGLCGQFINNERNYAEKMKNKKECIAYTEISLEELIAMEEGNDYDWNTDNYLDRDTFAEEWNEYMEDWN